MIAKEYLEAKNEDMLNELDFIQDFYRWIWGKPDVEDKKHWKDWTKENSVKFTESAMIESTR